MIKKIMLLALSGLSLSGLAQQQGNDASDDGINYEIGAHIGSLLPNQIPGLTEVTGVGGVRGGFRLSSVAFVEAAFAAGGGYGADYKNLSASVRFDAPIESFIGFMFVGIDVTDYVGLNSNNKYFGGGDVGGGLMTQLGGLVWLRSDMKFTFNPGISMYIDFSLLFRI